MDKQNVYKRAQYDVYRTFVQRLFFMLFILDNIARMDLIFFTCKNMLMHILSIKDILLKKNREPKITRK